jgi:hypothetical protein
VCIAVPFVETAGSQGAEHWSENSALSTGWVDRMVDYVDLEPIQVKTDDGSVTATWDSGPQISERRVLFRLDLRFAPQADDGPFVGSALRQGRKHHPGDQRGVRVV